MPIHQTFFEPTAVITEDTSTGVMTLEIDWFGAQVVSELSEKYPARTAAAVAHLDTMIFDNSTWVPIETPEDDDTIIVRVTRQADLPAPPTEGFVPPPSQTDAVPEGPPPLYNP